METTEQPARLASRRALPADAGPAYSPDPADCAHGFGWRLEAASRIVLRALSEYRERHGEGVADEPPPGRAPLPGLARRLRLRPERVSVLWHSWTDRAQIDPQFLELLRAVPGSGGALYVAVDEQAAEEPDVTHQLRLLADLGAAVRVHNRTLPDLLVVGDEAAVMRTGSSSHRRSGSQQLVLHDDIVASLAKLADAAWANSAPLEVFLSFQAERGRPAQSVLGLLSSGCTDEVAARKLNISVRTYRRHVANLMQRLNADSRFQAGLEAARLMERTTADTAGTN